MEVMKTEVTVTEEDLHSLSQLMSLPKEEFLAHFEGKDLGYVMSMRNFAISMFNDAKKIKDDLVEAFPDMHKDKKGRAKMILMELYGVMHNLEDKYYLLKELEVKRRSAPLV